MDKKDCPKFMLRYQKNKRNGVTGMKMKKDVKTSMINELPEDVIVEIISQVAQSSPLPFADLYNIKNTCKMFYALSSDIIVKQRIALEREFSSLNWTAPDHRMDVLNTCANAGNAEACFILALITIFEQKDIAKGGELLNKAMQKGHKPALYVMKILHLQLQEHHVSANVFSPDITKTDEGKLCDDYQFKLCREIALNIVRQVTWNKWHATSMENARPCKSTGCGIARGWNEHRIFCSDTCQWKFEYAAFCGEM